MKTNSQTIVAILAASFLSLPLCQQCFGQQEVPPPPPPPPASSAQPKKITRVRQGGNVSSKLLLSRVNPVYPQEAREKGIQGTVRLHAIIGRDGLVQQLEVMSGDKILASSATEAVRQWRYRPTLLNGEPVEVDTTIDVIFTLAKR